MRAQSRSNPIVRSTRTICGLTYSACRSSASPARASQQFAQLAHCDERVLRSRRTNRVRSPRRERVTQARAPPEILGRWRKRSGSATSPSGSSSREASSAAMRPSSSRSCPRRRGCRRRTATMPTRRRSTASRAVIVSGRRRAARGRAGRDSLIPGERSTGSRTRATPRQRCSPWSRRGCSARDFFREVAAVVEEAVAAGSPPDPARLGQVMVSHGLDSGALAIRGRARARPALRSRRCRPR